MAQFLTAVDRRLLQSGQKALLVLDQFEQWLHSRRGKENTELVAALRQCDGEHVQAVVLVRDDFWMAATRFMRDLEIRLLEGENSAAVDLFDIDHARKNLLAFGRAFGKLPENSSDASRDQKDFLKESVNGLAEEGKVISVRLALFAEMMKGKPWTPATLKQVGGTKGVGVTFLEETFSSSTAPPEHRLHQKAAQAVLKALLPESGTDIKGQMRSRQELLEASGHVNRPKDFDDLIHILDPELRLITPTDPEGSSSDRHATTNLEERYYQLTHDYLVHSLRDWLTRKQRETRRGRADLRLTERSSLWNAKPENRYLPSAFEWGNIRLLTSRKDWTKPQKMMMKRAGRVHGVRSVLSLVLVGCVVLGGLAVRRRLIEDRSATHAEGLVEQVLKASISQVPGIVDSMRDYRRWVDPALKKALAKSSEDAPKKLHASLALLPVDASQAEYLYDRLLNADPTELPVIWKLMLEYHQAPVDRLWKVMNDPKIDPDQRFRAACALANVEAGVETQQWDGVASLVADQLLASILKNPSNYPPLIETLRPVRGRLLAPLSRTFRDGNLESERSLATSILSDYAADRSEVLADLLMDATPPQFGTLFPKVQAVATQAVTALETELVRKLISEAKEEDRDKLAQRQARAAVALVRLGRTEKVWPLLCHSADPRLRSFIVNWLTPLGADPRTLFAELARLPMTVKPTPAEGQRFMEAVLFHPETSMRRALILAMGAYGKDWLSPGERNLLSGKLLDLYRNDPDAGIHGAAEWTLRQWKNDEKLKVIDGNLSQLKDRGERRWYVNSLGQTFTVIAGPVEFLMGSPPSEPARDSDEILHRVVIPRGFAIDTKEISVEQYRRFMNDSSTAQEHHVKVDQYSPDARGPMNGPNWYDAAAFCNWLSARKG